MDVVLLSRIQFAFTIGFHFLFPPMTLGLSLIILILEILYRRKKDQRYQTMSVFFVKILGLIFVLGTATGIVMEFSFGNNWSQYSRLVGDIFGAPLAAEGIFAFFMESIFLGILVFGRRKVSERLYLISAFLVFLGSHLSGLWIIMANSWMQTPAGFAMLNGRAVLTNFWQAALNHSTLIRFVHTVIASWITGSFFVAGISAYYLLNKRFKDLSRATLKLSLIILIITSLFELILGHAHSVQVARTQPAKMAAFEALYHTRQGAPLALFGFPDEKNQQNHFYIGLPYLLSFLIDFDFNAKVQGLSDFPEGERPPVFLPFVAYHVMILLGIFFIALSLVGAYLLKKKKLWETKWYLTVLAWAIPLPHVANQFGWLAAEVGRQPWAVYQVLKTADAVSVVVPAGQVLFSLLMFGIIYLIVFLAFVKALLRMIKKGPTVVKA